VLACFLHHQGDHLMMEAANTSESSAFFYQTTRRNNPKDSHLQKETFPASEPVRIS
jgi:hypothetical protein